MKGPLCALCVAHEGTSIWQGSF